MNSNEEPGVVAGANPGVMDCWNRIGVLGDGSCEKLAEVIHCRNCHVYSAARAQILDREPPPGYRHEWTQHFSEARPPATTDRISVVIFRIGTEWLALSTQVFHEVAQPRPIHSLPHRQGNLVLGLVNFRGELLICVSLGRLLGITPEVPPKEMNDSGRRLMIVEWQGSFLAFPVDEILGIHRYAPDEMKALPATVAGSALSLTRGVLAWQDRTVGCLDEERLFATLNRGLA